MRTFKYFLTLDVCKPIVGDLQNKIRNRGNTLLKGVCIRLT